MQTDKYLQMQTDKSLKMQTDKYLQMQTDKSNSLTIDWFPYERLISMSGEKDKAFHKYIISTQMLRMVITKEIIHSKSEKVYGTAFSVNKICGKSA